MMTDTGAGSSSPEDVARATRTGQDSPGDIADQADRLTMIMEAEAAHNALNGGGGEGSDDDLPYPLEDVEELLAAEDADDASDDPMHSGGLTPAPWIPAEQAAMHVIDEDDLDDVEYVGDETDAEKADPFRDQFDGAPRDLTAEDQTILGVDPYGTGESQER